MSPADRRRRRGRVMLMVALLALLGSVLASFAVGPLRLPPLEVVQALGVKLGLLDPQAVSSRDLAVVWQLRIPRAPVLAWRLEPARAADLIRMAQGLASLAQEDPSFRVETDRDTAETLVWGMGELHLEVMVERLRSEWKVEVGVGAPRVAYQETPMRAVAGVVGRLVKQTGGQGQFAQVVLDVAPREDGEVVFNDRIVGGVVPRSFIAAVEKGVRAALSEGPQGHPVVGIEVSLVDGQTHAKDSSEMAFHRAGAEAIKAALAEGGTQLLEPVMAVTVHSPSASVGDVVGDLNRRHGRIARIEDQDGRAEVSGFAPLAQLVGYTTSLRSLSQGRASSEAHLHGYEPVRAA